MSDRELMQQALDLLEKLNKDGWILADFEDEVYAAIDALRARLAQPEQEPVAWWDRVGRFATVKEKDWDRRTGGILSFGRDIPLYTAPPQREWQGLTDEEIEDTCWTEVDQRLRSFARAIETKLKEKNYGNDNL